MNRPFKQGEPCSEPRGRNGGTSGSAVHADRPLVVGR